MIVFDLECFNGHAFEGWFDDGETFHRQQEEGMVSCPVCHSTAVVQKLSPVAVRTSANAATQTGLSPEALMKLGARLAEFVETNFENVGADFAKEALRMHYGVTESKNIRGVTTHEEDRILSEEGVAVFKLPVGAKPGEDLN
ncbi:MAG: DUF1178 family protein [Pseudomonadota bacterium]